MALDIGKNSVKEFNKFINNAGTIFWNGPAGVSEWIGFEYGTKEICKSLVSATKNGTFTLIGGGDSAAAAIHLGFKETDFGFISTGGGASLEFIEGKELPGISCIQDR
jgi:phosphoglycerate kinase